MTVIAAAEVPWLSCTLLLYFPPSIAWENLMMSSNDVMIICSINLVGKLLCMHRRTVIFCLCICQHPCQINQKWQRFQTSSSFFWTLFRACDTLPQVFWCTIVLWTTLLNNFNIGTIKQINHNNVVKTIKIRWVYTQSNYRCKSIYVVTNIQHSTNATMLGVSVDSVHSSLTNVGHK